MGFFDRFTGKNGQEAGVESTKLVPGVGRMPYPAYRGKEPYIFISYAHKDMEKVYAEIRRFNEAGFNVWYDEGIAPGNEWTDDIADALAGCAVFVVMITPISATRDNVLNEINFALDEKKPFIAIHFEETELKRGLKLQIGTKQAIFKYNMSDEEYAYKFTDAFNRLGLKSKKGSDQTEIIKLDAQKPKTFIDSAEDAKKRANGDLVRVDDFDIEHGLLRDYIGEEKNIKVPRAAGVIGSRAFNRSRMFIESVDLNQAGMIISGAFDNCPNLKEIRIPETINEVNRTCLRIALI